MSLFELCKHDDILEMKTEEVDYGNGKVLLNTVPNTVQQADAEAYHQADDLLDANGMIARADLRKNRMRCDLWNASMGELHGGNRWQCERAARYWRDLCRARHGSAHKLEDWANKERLVEKLREAVICKTAPQERADAVCVLFHEYCRIPGPVKACLAMANAATVRDTENCEAPST